MTNMSPEQFETLWANAKNQPAVRKLEPQPIKADLSLSGMLNQYLTLATKFRNGGKISQVEHEALIAAMTALNVVLTRIKEKELIADEMGGTLDGPR